MAAGPSQRFVSKYSLTSFISVGSGAGCEGFGVSFLLKFADDCVCNSFFACLAACGSF